ncbi:MULTISPECIES: hypothetical protein [Anaerolinea]|uniref:hypothetical protein n=1 Tax=Anaerolinea TaxID=233189 RepID=UPI002627F438|nr:hypothetical protein [Anaerolinea thermophila]
MAKKFKRSVSASRSQTAEATAPQTPASGTGSISRRATASDFNPDYTPIIRDLKRIGTLAGTFFVILIILSFVLNR